MTCQEARERLSAEEDDALGADERAALAAHLASCASCPAYRRDLRAVVGVLRAPARETAPADLRARLEAAFGGRRRTRRGLGVGAAVVACVAVFAWWATRPRGALVEEVVGSLALWRGGASFPLAAGQALLPGDTVRTQAGRARLRLDGEAQVALEERTTLRLGPRPVVVLLQRGRARFEVAPGHGELRVETPAGEVVVTGTAFAVEVLPIDKEVDVVKRIALGFVGATVVGAIVLVTVTRGSVEVRGGGDALTVTAGETVEVVSGQRPERAPPTGSGRVAERLSQQNAALRSEVAALRAEVARKQAQAAALPARGAVDTTRDVRAPLTADERKLLGAANLGVSAEIRAKLAAIYQEANGRPPPGEMDEMALTKELIKDLRLEHIPALGSLPKGADTPEMIKAGLPPDAARAMRLMQERNIRVQEELAKTLSTERAAAVARTIRATTHVGSSDGGKTVDAYVDLGVPPAPGEALPAPEAKPQAKPEAKEGR